MASPPRARFSTVGFGTTVAGSNGGCEDAGTDASRARTHTVRAAIRFTARPPNIEGAVTLTWGRLSTEVLFAGTGPLRRCPAARRTAGSDFGLMSAVGHLRTSGDVRPMSAVTAKADIAQCGRDVRFC